MTGTTISAMPRPCSVCNSPFEAALHEAFQDGVSYRNLAAHFRLSHAAVHRHEKSHHYEKRRGLPVVHAAPKPYPQLPAPRNEPVSPPSNSPSEGGVAGAYQRNFIQGLLRAYRRTG